MVNVSKKIRNYKDEILEDIVNIVEIPSVRGEAKNGKPFGEQSAKALQFCLDLADSMGFTTKNVGNFAGHIEYGDGDEIFGVLAHCDIVAAGDGWNTDPFKATFDNGRLYGRGTMDDKGPAIAAIYCLKALKDLGIKPKRRIRIIIGASEECGMEDLENYFKTEPMPDFAFSPDGEYPICNREKGIMHISIKAPHTSEAIKSVKSGNAANIVPMLADAVVTSAVSDELFDRASADAKEDNLNFTIKKAHCGKKIQCEGIAAHASTPEEGVNAASGLIRLFTGMFGEDAGKMTAFLDKTIGYECDGASMGVKCSDKESGPLTLNLGVLDFDDENDSAVIDIRYPVTCKGSEIFDTINKKAESFGIEATLISDSKPLFVDENNLLITKLSHAYKTVTGEQAELYSSGGGTYARELSCGVAFGPGTKTLSFYNIHGANEFLDVEEFMKHCEICLQAMYELGCE